MTPEQLEYIKKSAAELEQNAIDSVNVIVNEPGATDTLLQILIQTLVVQAKLQIFTLAPELLAPAPPVKDDATNTTATPP